MPEPENNAMPAEPREGASAPDVGLIDAAIQLIQTAVTYVRQETGDLVREKIVLPTQRAGGTVALAIVVAFLVLVGLLFISAGALMLLASWIGWIGALFTVGGVLVFGSIIVAAIRFRSMQK